jgi:hypothetical protein
MPTVPASGDGVPPGAPPSYDPATSKTVGPEKGNMTEDERYARKLQAEEDARAGTGSSNTRGDADNYYGGPSTGGMPMANQGGYAGGQQYGGGLAPPSYDTGISSPGTSPGKKGFLGKLFGKKPQQQGMYGNPYQQSPYQQQQQYVQQQPGRMGMGGMGMAGGAALGLGGGLLGGVLLESAIDGGDHGGYGGDDGGNYGGDDGGGGGGDFGGDGGGGGDF